MDKKLEIEWFNWAKKNRKRIVEKILLQYTDSYYRTKQIIFLSGSPWAWKTEFIKWLLQKWFDKYFINIDLDELRILIPWYKWEEADSFQKWAIKILEMFLDKAFKQNLNIILDWTFWSKTATNRNIKRAIKKWYNIKIYYIKFDPILAWKFTLWREIDKERKVPFFFFSLAYNFKYNKLFML